nr:MAG TPA: hypothetical protein [Caudoviricetes sp.]
MKRFESITKIINNAIIELNTGVNLLISSIKLFKKTLP